VVLVLVLVLGVVAHPDGLVLFVDILERVLLLMCIMAGRTGVFGSGDLIMLRDGIRSDRPRSGLGAGGLGGLGSALAAGPGAGRECFLCNVTHHVVVKDLRYR
jgi:hypothetical protein